MDQPLIPVPHGELLDKITILEIKSERIKDASKVSNVARELSALQEIWQAVRAGAEGSAARHLDALHQELRAINETLWDIEDRIRLKEAAAAFDEEFIELARSVYVTNDERAASKRRVNEALGSRLIEEKSYAPYRPA